MLFRLNNMQMMITAMAHVGGLLQNAHQACSAASLTGRQDFAPNLKPAVTQTDMKPPVCIAQLNTTSHERTVDLTRNFEDPGILPGFANQYILGDVHLRSSVQGNRRTILLYADKSQIKLMTCLLRLCARRA